jgi:phosphoglycolate phosphatase-like HAD superfamily hydrolase
LAGRARLFDLDGTLWDSYPWYAAVIGQSGRMSESDALALLRAGDSIVTMIRRLGLPHNTIERALGDGIGQVVGVRGVGDALDGLRLGGGLMGVVTSLPGRIAEPALQRLGFAEMFRVVIHAGSGAGSKPSPRPLLTALRDLGVDIAPTHWYVGDTERDAIAASRAGISFAWVSWGYGTPPPDATVLHQPADILDL